MNLKSTKADQTHELIGIDELAALIGVGKNTIRRSIKRGTIPQPVKFGRLLRWSRREVSAWLANGLPGVPRMIAR